jgi:hypothetical protein
MRFGGVLVGFAGWFCDSKAGTLVQQERGASLRSVPYLRLMRGFGLQGAANRTYNTFSRNCWVDRRMIGRQVI